MISKCRPVDTGRSVGGRRRQYSVRPGLAKWVGRASAPVLALAASMLTLTPANAQLPGPQAAPGEASPLQPGEAFVTRFSGSRMSGNEDEGVRRVIDVNGTVGSIIDVRAPGQAPMGQHWTDEPQRARVTAGQVGQVFGVALDDAEPPNIYVTATAAFGLHLNPGTSEWMAGMWGRGGGPGTVYKLDRDNGYQPRVFANIALNGRQNSGAALGNIAFDRFNRQLLVSDMETGMIHRLRLSDGADLGFFDHGTQGRASFLDVASGETRSLPAKAFDPSSRARLGNCPSGRFDRNPDCWNVARSGRRPWGLGVWQDPGKQEARLYYAVWSGPAFGNRAWSSEPDTDKRNAVWSVRLGQNGEFDPSSVRREFELPDFFTNAQQVERAGYSSPVSDISFSQCGERPVMLVAERGGMRNLGLSAENPFSYPHEARALRYELDQRGAWRPVGRYDVGFYDRKSEGQPFLRANCSGGIAFAPGYDPQTWTVDLARKDEFVWMSGHVLCSPIGPCRMPAAEDETASEEKDASVKPAAAKEEEERGPDDSQVHGIQGTPEKALEELAPESAYRNYPADGESRPAAGPMQSYLIDTDINVDGAGGLIEEELSRNDATKIGDIAIYQPCAPRPVGSSVPASFLLPPPPSEPVTIVGHPTDASHARVASHGTDLSHSRWGSHNYYGSHSRWGSHNTDWSHNRDGSHGVYWSHNRWGSHARRESHSRWASHGRVLSHHWLASHGRFVSHGRHRSHNLSISHNHTGSHNRKLSHSRLRSHDYAHSHNRLASHTTHLSHSHKGSHSLALSHNKTHSHSTIVSKSNVHELKHSKGNTHGVAKSMGGHTAAQSKGKHHSTILSKGTVHTLAKSGATHHTTIQSKSTSVTAGEKKGHTLAQSKGTHHSTIASKGAVHTVAKSKGGTHTTAQSAAATKRSTTTKLLDTKKHTPVIKKHTPVIKKHEPVVKKHTPVIKKHTPVIKKHTPVIKKTPVPKVIRKSSGASSTHKVIVKKAPVRTAPVKRVHTVAASKRK